jgi:glycosyltransferase involved in cell wall biosynthesis
MEISNPLFSIIIPTRNRPKELKNCLNAIGYLNYSNSSFEVIVVNDGGDDSSEEVIDYFEDKLNIVRIRQPQSGPASARNEGARIAKGKYIVFTDDDCLPAPNWLSELEESLKKYPDSIVGGKTLNQLNDNLYSTASQVICELAYKHYNENGEEPTFFCTNNMALSREKFYEIKGFDESLQTAEDRDLCKRWNNQGLKMIYAPEAIIRHAHSLTFPGFVMQHFKYGRGSYRFYNKKILHGPGYFRSLLRFNINPKNLIGYPLTNYKGIKGIKLSVLLLIWQFTNASGFFFELLTNKVKLTDSNVRNSRSNTDKSNSPSR